MPPWKAEPGFGDFVGARRLEDAQIAMLQRWADEGASQGDLRLAPKLPLKEANSWQLGTPDAIVAMPEAYKLSAQGGDRFRNFVMPIPISKRQYVTAWEFRAEGIGAIHHATFLIDQTRTSRRLDNEDPAPGYEGRVPFSARSPDGFFLGWAPGQSPQQSQQHLAWHIEPDSDLVVTLHLRPVGEEALIRVSIGLYLSDVPPARTPFMIRLSRQNIDIPAGDSHYQISDSYILPVDIQLNAIRPHAHNLAKQIRAFATLPNGSVIWLLYIKDWDFFWQDEYQYRTPLSLPAGTKITMAYEYDNSPSNRQNPNSPAKRVAFGPLDTNEMADLWIQVLPRRPADLAILAKDFLPKLLTENIVGYRTLLSSAPLDVGLHTDLASAYVAAGNLDAAEAEFAAALRLAPDSATALGNMGAVLLLRRKLVEARAYLTKAVEADPNHWFSHYYLGMVAQAEGSLDVAVREYQDALRLAPNYAEAHDNLGIVFQTQGLVDDALRHYREAVRINPEYAGAFYRLGALLATKDQASEAIRYFRRAIALEPDWPAALAGLAWLLATTPDAGPDGVFHEEAVRLASRAAELTEGRDDTILDILATALASVGEFERAVSTANAALELAVAANDNRLERSIRQRLELYMRRKPYDLHR
jgi:tetratricopeptide (TPR) repeat protein